jgi:phosphoribosylformimino-5-aminoimidazole carboxamide ribotide isomerase
MTVNSASSLHPFVLPVLDLLNGVVVRGVAGRREEYRPILSRLTSSSAPLDVARALRNEFGFERLYVADLDGIVERRPNWKIARQLIEAGFKLLVDAGVETTEDVRNWSSLGCEVVIGLESCRSPGELSAMAAACESVTFSLDLQDGVPKRHPAASDWSDAPLEIARQIMRCGVRKLIVLDLADVGMGDGARTGSLCHSILTEFPDVHLTCGGGVRDREDLRCWREVGVKQVLVASALHDGRLIPARESRNAREELEPRI